MAMTGAGLWAARKAAIAAVTPVAGSDASAAIAYREAIGLADSTAIVQYIQSNMVVNSTGADPQGGTVTSTSTSVQ